ncbi:MAG: hypothetical protein IJX17_08050 [Clostridia bacterium]|nr:hypothetical protein [Clostridia bacterium]
MNKLRLMKYLDFLSFVTIVFSSIAVVFFQITANVMLLKYGVVLFTFSILCLLGFMGIILYVYFKEDKNKVKKRDIILLIIKMILTVMVFCFIIVVFFSIKRN